MDFPDWHAEQTPSKIAYTVGDASVTYRQMVDTSVQVGNLLHARGVRPGETVAILLPNMIGMLDIAWACQRSGLRYTAISDRLTASEVTYILGDSGAKALFTCSRHAATVRTALAELTTPPAVFSLDEAEGFESLSATIADQPTTPTHEESEGVDLLYSSGTTGRPKGVAARLDPVPLGTAAGTGPFLQKTWNFGADCIYLSPAPLYHAAPMRTSMTVQRFGGTVHVMEKFDAEAALALVERHHVTHTQMVPTMFVRMLQLPDETRSRYDLSSLRAVIHAAAPCPPAVKKAMIEWVGPIVDEYYSSTEAVLMTLIRAEEALERPGSVGKAILGTPHIVGPDGQEQPAGEPGIIWSEGGLDFEYLHDPERTAASRNDRGWRTVGDIGYLDAEGYLFLSDRREDLIIIGGVNVYPQETENTLLEHPAVADAAVFGVPNLEYGEEVRAVIQLLPGHTGSDELAAELIEFCKARLSSLKAPRSVTFADDLPRTPTGKLLRRVLRDDNNHQTT